MNRENKITPRRVLLNISARCRLAPIYYHILLITRMLLLLYKKLVVHFPVVVYPIFSRPFLSSLCSTIAVGILTVSEPPSRNTSFLNTFHTSATTYYYREIVLLILLPIFQLASPHSLKNIIPNKSPHIPLSQCSSTNVAIIVPQNLLLQMKLELVLSARQRKVIKFIFKNIFKSEY